MKQHYTLLILSVWKELHSIFFFFFQLSDFVVWFSREVIETPKLWILIWSWGQLGSDWKPLTYMSRRACANKSIENIFHCLSPTKTSGRDYQCPQFQTTACLRRSHFPAMWFRTKSLSECGTGPTGQRSRQWPSHGSYNACLNAKTIYFWRGFEKRCELKVIGEISPWSDPQSWTVDLKLTMKILNKKKKEKKKMIRV